MKLESSSIAGGKIALILGWLLSLIPILFMGVMPTILLFTQRKMMVDGQAKYGYPAEDFWLIVGLQIGCTVIYAFPPTAVLGAILLTGYLGGAVATHVRANENIWWAPVAVGVIVWLGIFLRDKRLRGLLPFRH